MSTWISSPALHPAALLCAAVLLLVSACTLQAPVNRAAAVPETLRRFPVLDHAVVITAPPGYCIDLPGSRSERRDAFVLLASCRAVMADPSAPTPASPGLLMAGVDGREASPLPTEAGLDRFFASPAGRMALSRRGDPGSVRLGESRYRDGTYLLHVRESGGDPAMGPQSWRAIFEVNGRIVTATLQELAGLPIAGAEAFRTLEQFARDIRRASP